MLRNKIRLIGMLSSCLALCIPQSFAQFGGFAISRELFEFIRQTLPDGSTILELGSGSGTGELCRHYRMYSIEQDKKWLNTYNSTYIHAPLKNRWYDVTILREKLPTIPTYDCILIDGPSGGLPNGIL